MKCQNIIHLLHPVIAPALHDLAELFEGDPIPEEEEYEDLDGDGDEDKEENKDKGEKKDEDKKENVT